MKIFKLLLALPINLKKELKHEKYFTNFRLLSSLLQCNLLLQSNFIASLPDLQLKLPQGCSPPTFAQVIGSCQMCHARLPSDYLMSIIFTPKEIEPE